MKISKFTNYVLDGDVLIISSSLYGSITSFCGEDKDYLLLLLKGNINILENLPSDIISVLTKQKILIDDYVDENAVLELFKLRKDINYVQFFLIVTRQCNFRCPYCAQDHETRVMAEKVYQQSLKFILEYIANNHPQHIYISFFGGEPTLEMINIVKFLKELNVKVKNFAWSPKVIGQITSNGYLLDKENFLMLIDNGVTHYQITVDGFADSHDVNRHLVNGKGTWQVIMNNLLAMKHTQRKFSVQIRTNYTRKIYNDFERWLEFLDDNFGSDKRFSFYFESAKDYGTVGSADNVDIMATSSREEENLYTILVNKKISMPYYYNILNFRGLCCYAAKQNSIAIDWDGSLIKCTFNFEKESNKVGDIFASKDIINVEKFSKMLALRYPQECESCTILPICLGKRCPNIQKQQCNFNKQQYLKGVRYVYHKRKSFYS